MPCSFPTALCIPQPFLLIDEYNPLSVAETLSIKKLETLIIKPHGLDSYLSCTILGGPFRGGQFPLPILFAIHASSLLNARDNLRHNLAERRAL
jgi:hypothetical protein